MNEHISQKLVDTLIKLDLKKEKDYEKDLSQLLDEEPYLMGFLFNISDDFTEQSHELLLRSTLALRQSLLNSGLFFNMISPNELEEVISQNIKQFDELLGEEDFDADLIYSHASSPVVLKELTNFITLNTSDEEPNAASTEKLMLVLSSIIELFERSATANNPENQE